MIKKYIITIVVIIGILLILFGSYYIYSSNNSQNIQKDLKSKVQAETKYLNTTIITMLNGLNNISYANYQIIEQEVPTQDENSQSSQTEKQGEESSGGGESGEESKSSSNTITNMNMNYSSVLVNPKKEIDWASLKKEIEKMYSTWSTILIDLNTLNVNKDNLLKYTQILDNLTKSAQNKDKRTSLKELSNLYNLVVSYMKDYGADSKLISLYETKSYILQAYSLTEEDNAWQQMKTSIQNAKNTYMNIMNNNNINNTQKLSNINKAYVILNELEKIADTKDKDIFLINYKNVMQELEFIED